MIRMKRIYIYLIHIERTHLMIHTERIHRSDLHHSHRNASHDSQRNISHDSHRKDSYDSHRKDSNNKSHRNDSDDSQRKDLHNNSHRIHVFTCFYISTVLLY